MDQDKVQKAFELIAQRENLTVDEVIDKIAMAIALTLKSNDPDMFEFWKRIPGGRDGLGVNEVIDLIAQCYATDILGMETDD